MPERRKDAWEPDPREATEHLPARHKRTLGDVPVPPTTTQRLPTATRRESVIPRPFQTPSQRLPTTTPQQGARRVPAAPYAPATAPWRGARTLLTSLAIAVTVVVSVGFGAVRALRPDDARGQQSVPGTTAAGQPTTGTPAPSGSIPQGIWVASAGTIVYIPPPPKPPAQTTSQTQTQTYISSIQPCHDTVRFVANITQWTVPPGCYANVFVPNSANYPPRPIFGYCNWWVRQNHPNNPDITVGSQTYLGTTPVAGTAVFFEGNVQGASPEGHWAEVVAVAPDRYWFLLSEMNFAWRGAGFAKVDYRYAHLGAGVTFYT
ncbi:MAG: hypothetical protein IVW57_09135 [Ktedonobacterales bacterium]|nr:hypothetical protein [Ktedonobacterales bacterium]